MGNENTCFPPKPFKPEDVRSSGSFSHLSNQHCYMTIGTSSLNHAVIFNLLSSAEFDLRPFPLDAAITFHPLIAHPLGPWGDKLQHCADMLRLS